MPTKTKVAPTTKKLYKELSKGKDLTQREISSMLWKVSHKGEENFTCPTSYWHGSLMRHVENKRISKLKRNGRIIYRINKTGRKYAEKKGIIKT
jgi:hypothetical protein